MKKIIAILAVAFAISVNSQANTTTVENDQTTVATPEFVVIKLADLTEPVQVAIKTEVEKDGQTIKEVSQHKETKKIKVVVVKGDKTEVVYNFDEAGKLQVEEVKK